MKSALISFVLVVIAVGIHMVAHADALSATYAASPVGFVLGLFSAYFITYAMLFCLVVAVRLAMEKCDK